MPVFLWDQFLMKKFLQNKKLLSAFIIVIVVLVVLGGSVSLRKKRNTPLLIQSLGNDIVALGTRIVDVPVGWVSEIGRASCRERV